MIESFLSNMVPLFKSHYSIGKSILRLDLKSFEKENSNNIFYIAKKHNLKNIVLLEDSMTGFLEAFNNSQKLGFNLIFGLRLNICQDNKIESTNQSSKILVFSKNAKGCKDLSTLYSKYNCDLSQCLDLQSLSELLTKNLYISIPFYDSFLYYNYFYFNSLVLDFKQYKPTFFIENNNLPFDSLLESVVLNYCKKNDFDHFSCKSIFYNSRSDFRAYQTYKCICGRSFSSRNATIENPRLDHCASDDFSFESYFALF